MNARVGPESGFDYDPGAVDGSSQDRCIAVDHRREAGGLRVAWIVARVSQVRAGSRRIYTSAMAVAEFTTPLDLEKIRADFPILAQPVHGKRLVFLDSAASSQKPR